MDLDLAETHTSRGWRSATPEASVLISSFRRPHYLPELFAALEAQSLDATRFEVVIADNGSGDGTWAAMNEWIHSTSLVACAARVAENGGPATGRNAAFGLARAPLVVFTDDDCLPEPQWVAAMLDALREGGRVVQGRTEAEEGKRRDQWDHTLTVRRPTPFFETCNIGYHRDDLLAAGGFRPLAGYRAGRGGTPFGGEDTVLGWNVLRATRSQVAFATHAVVHHRIEPRSYRGWLHERNGMAIFPALVAEVPEIRKQLYFRYFFSRRSATLDIGLVGFLVALAFRSPWPLVVALPYVALYVAPRRLRGLRGWANLAAPTFVGDLAMVSSLLRGSFRYRRVVA